VSLKTEKSGHDKIVNQFKEGDVFGETCLVSKKPALESIMSLVTIILYRPMEKSTA
jgi:CRP-like cAMP-binding protein